MTVGLYDRPAHWPAHWKWIDLPESEDGDLRLVEAVNALMGTTAAAPCSDGREYPVLDMDPDPNELPRDHTEGTDEDPITLTAVVRLAKAVLAVADQYRTQENGAAP